MIEKKKNRGLQSRRQHNTDLIRRMRNGEPLNTIDSKSSWYPPRPTIKKDAGEMARVYGAPLEIQHSDEVDGDSGLAQVTRFRAS